MRQRKEDLGFNETHICVMPDYEPSVLTEELRDLKLKKNINLFRRDELDFRYVVTVINC